ncbi:hypothetical protein BHM03_00046701 [Ensete ventricosum]|nr:hypothetical protein BHM03_00046701 [Ensete ventricosum]
MRWDLAVSLLGDSPKGSGSSLGTHREITGRRPEDLPQECQKLLDWQNITLSTLFISMTLWHDQRLLGTLAESLVITLGLAKRCKAESNNLSAMEVAFMQPRVVATWGPWRQGIPGR